MNNTTKWLISFFAAILLFLVGHFLSLIIESSKWFLLPLALIVFVLSVIVIRNNIVR